MKKKGKPCRPADGWQKLFRIMKLSMILLLVGVMHVSASVYSQTTKLTVDVQNQKVVEVLNAIEAQSEFRFFYKNEQVDVNRQVNIRAKDKQVEQILDEMFAATDVEYKFFEDKLILLSSKEAMERDYESIQSQKTITGKVSDENGESLPGVSVIIKGTTTGTVTDIDGNYSLTVVEEGVTLVYSFVGMKTQEVLIENQTTVDVVLAVDAIGIEEVVAIGYGTARRKDLSGAVETKRLEDSPQANIATTNIIQSLEGVSGVNIAPQNSPGRTPNIIVRGQNSINGNNDPLIVLDGVIFQGSVTDINPNDITYIDVLKDASSTAVYGSRAANGVIVITTKNGKSTKPLIRFNTSAGVNTWTNKFDMMDRDRWAEKYAAQHNTTIDELVFDDVTATEYFNSGISNDWVDLVSRTGVTQDYQASVSGRAEKVNYYFSGSYNSTEGVIVGDDYQRISVRTKMDVDVTDWLKVGLDGLYNNNDYSGIGASVSGATYISPQSYPYRYEGMPFNVSTANPTGLERWPIGQSIQSPLWGTDGETVDDIDKSNFFRFSGYAFVQVPKIKGLTYRLQYSANTKYSRQDRFYYENYYVGEHSTGYYARYTPAELQKRLSQANGYNRLTNEYNYVLDNIVNYKREFGDHYVDATLVATRDYSYWKRNEMTGSNFESAGNTSLGVNGLPKAEVQKIYTNIVKRTNIGYLGRLSYAFKDRYHLTASVRRDGASVFGSDNKWGYFPSVGAAWTVSEEDFFNNDGVVNYLKMKLSYGKNGNQGLSPYQTLAKVSSGPDGSIEYEFGDRPSSIIYGVKQDNLANPNLGWETTTSLNGGFQSALLDSRIIVDLDFYFSTTTDQIFNRGIPIMTGYNSILSTFGELDNKGLEIDVTTVNIDNGNFKWDSHLSFWLNRNKIVSLYGDDNDGDGVEDDDIANSLFIGKSLGAIYGYEYIGVVQEDDTDYIEKNSAQPGDAMFRDLDGDGVITADDDRKILGFRKENFRMSLSNTFTYKNFSLYMMFTGIFGGGKDNYYLSENPAHNSFRTRFDINEPDHDWWTPENKSEKYLRPNYLGGRYLGLQSRGFVKLQNISLSYKLPKAILSDVGIAGLEVFTSASNVFTITNWYGGGDPELGITPYSGSYPVPTTVTMGLNVSF
ncbi:TonB-dependent receptor [uncultured Draconibacterium sp.]|uniref:TonB-dependent receptor n=1 Tax=uncultured Draconibacterium sp. TaxID=1573823 RepID=UPI003260A4A7